MKREILRKLQAWKTQKDRKPLILKGVRQCGKTYILQAFGQQAFRRCFVLNFEQQTSAHQLFTGDLNRQILLTNLAFFFNESIDLKHDLLILDEIQACPRAITSLKYFCEQLPELAVCAAGSLLGLELTPASFPVGKVTFLSLYPMNFNEFLLALNDNKAIDLLQQLNLDQLKTDHLTQYITPVTHEYLWERFKWYCIVGGLPEAVQTFIDHQEDLFTAFRLVREKQAALINGYYADIAKHAGKQNAMHIERTFRAVPTQLAKAQNSQAPRFQFSNIVPGADRYQRLAGAIDWLNKAGLIIQTPIVNHIEQPLHAFSKQSLFKLYCSDIGLLGAMNQLTPKVILDFKFGTYKGYFAENFVIQQLVSTLENNAIFCWQQNRHEIEFIYQHIDQVIPIEVKSGHITRAKSLTAYQQQYQPTWAIILDGNLPKYLEEHQRLHLPLYIAQYLPQLFNNNSK